MLAPRLSFAQRSALCAVGCLLAGFVTRAAHRGAPAGTWRLALAAPALVLLLALPALFDRETEVVAYVLACATLGWWGSTRVLLVAAGRAPLPRTASLLRYAAFLCAPVQEASAAGAAAAAPPAATLAARALVKAAALRFVVACLRLDELRAPPAHSALGCARDTLFSFALWLFLGGTMDTAGAALACVSSVQLEPHFSNPALSPSLASFWSQRWNQCAAGLLRRAVYEPVLDGALVGNDADSPPAASGRLAPARRRARPSAGRSALAVCACFLASGAAHETILWAATRRRPTFQWLAYFTIQGPLVVAERALRRRAPPSPRTVALTWLLLLLPASVLFFPPVVNSGLADRVVKAVHALLS